MAKPRIELISASVFTGGAIITSATVVLEIDGVEEKQCVSGDDLYEAIFNAVKAMTDHEEAIFSYNVSRKFGDKESRFQCEVRENGCRKSVLRAGADTVAMAAEAFVEAFNFIEAKAGAKAD